VKALEAENILGPCVRLVDATKIDRGVTVMTQVRLKSRVGDQPTKFVNFVMLRTEIMECYSMAGDWDYQLRVVAADITDYERFLQELLRHPSVASVSSQFALKQVKYTTAIPV
jgi:Lrp/AsnC family transcriptional regulator